MPSECALALRERLLRQQHHVMTTIIMSTITPTMLPTSNRVCCLDNATCECELAPFTLNDDDADELQAVMMHDEMEVNDEECTNELAECDAFGVSGDELDEEPGVVDDDVVGGRLEAIGIREVPAETDVRLLEGLEYMKTFVGSEADDVSELVPGAFEGEDVVRVTSVNEYNLGVVVVECAGVLELNADELNVGVVLLPQGGQVEYVVFVDEDEAIKEFVV